MSESPATPPRVVLVYGLLGIIPFWSLSLARLVAPSLAGLGVIVAALYAGLILSFLGGARWGLAVREPAPNPAVIGLSMIPTLAGLAALVVLHGQARAQLLVLAAALALSWAWDVRAEGLPAWYGRLRSLLTLGAVAGLCVGALQVSA